MAGWTAGGLMAPGTIPVDIDRVGNAAIAPVSWCAAGSLVSLGARVRRASPRGFTVGGTISASGDPGVSVPWPLCEGRRQTIGGVVASSSVPRDAGRVTGTYLTA